MESDEDSVTNATTEFELVETEVESYPETLDNSSVTLLPGPKSGGGSSMDDLIEEYLSSQFSQSSKEEENKDAQQDVKNWLENVGEAPDTSEVDNEASLDFLQDVEKIAAILVDSIVNDDFDPEAWILNNDDEQQVPTCDQRKMEFIQEIQQRPALALMNIIKGCCSEDANKNAMYLYSEILRCATVKMKMKTLPETESNRTTEEATSSENSTVVYPASFAKLRNSNRGEYFSELRLRFNRGTPKSKVPIVKAVEKYVTSSINNAFDSGNAVIFTGYALIPTVVQNCVSNKRLQFSAEQVAKYGLRLQRAVYDAMMSRCLNFLAHIGHDLRLLAIPESTGYLSSNDSATSNPSSQELNDDVDAMGSMGSEGSQNSGSSSQTPSLAPSLEQAIAIRNNPELLMEFLRQNLNRNSHSPNGSMGSYPSLSPPSYSLPEVNRIPPPVPEFIQAEDNGLGGSMENIQINFLSVLEPVEQPQISNSLDSQESHDSLDGPRRRRRRLN